MALDECRQHDINCHDRSTHDEYVAELSVIYRDQVILFADEQDHIIRRDRYPGSSKAKFWEEIYNTVMGGTVPYRDWRDHMTLCRDACICQPYYPMGHSSDVI